VGVQARADLLLRVRFRSTILPVAIAIPRGGCSAALPGVLVFSIAEDNELGVAKVLAIVVVITSETPRGKCRMTAMRAMLVVFLVWMGAPAAMAQEVPARTRMWAAVGIGAGLPTSGGDGIANMAQLVVQKAPNHIALRGLVLHDLDRSTKTIGEAGLLYGRAKTTPWGHAAAAAGVSALGFDTCPDDDDSCFTFGVPIVVEAARNGRFAGLGVQAFANLNAKASYAGGLLMLQLGRLR
jgi:hypothetical protein